MTLNSSFRGESPHHKSSQNLNLMNLQKIHFPFKKRFPNPNTISHVHLFGVPLKI